MCCNRVATAIHHSRYHKNDLIGRTTKFLHPVCASCHRDFEFTWRSGKKRDLVNANGVMNYMAAKSYDGKSMAENAAEIHETLDAEFDAIFGR